MTAIFRLFDIRKMYGSREVLHIEGLEFFPGRRYCVLGPNGSGKTTLLRIMSLLMKQDRGDLYIWGEKISWEQEQLLRLRRQMAVVTQSTYMFQGSVFYNMAYGLKMRRIPRRKISHKIHEALDILGMREFKQADANSLSGGERQKIAIARALTVQPRVLFLDEPTANIDNKSIMEIENHIKDINTGYGTTIIMNTHDIFQARRMADHIIMMWDGRIIEQGGPQLFEQAKDTRARAFLSGQVVDDQV